MKLAGQINGLRTARLHLSAQVEGGVDTPHATCDEAREALVNVEAQLAELEPEARKLPELSYLFSTGGRRRTGRTRVFSPQSSKSPSSNDLKEDTMARKSAAAQLEEVQLELRRAEKSAGSTKWALEGAGAKRNPPSPERKKALKEKLSKEQARVAELRAKRDKLKPKSKQAA